jgi:hypothetical protein
MMARLFITLSLCGFVLAVAAVAPPLALFALPGCIAAAVWGARALTHDDQPGGSS